MDVSFGQVLRIALGFGGDQNVVDSLVTRIISVAADNRMLDGVIPIGNPILVDSNVMVFVQEELIHVIYLNIIDQPIIVVNLEVVGTHNHQHIALVVELLHLEPGILQLSLDGITEDPILIHLPTGQVDIILAKYDVVTVLLLQYLGFENWFHLAIVNPYFYYIEAIIHIQNEYRILKVVSQVLDLYGIPPKSTSSIRRQVFKFRSGYNLVEDYPS